MRAEMETEKQNIEQEKTKLLEDQQIQEAVYI